MGRQTEREQSKYEDKKLLKYPRIIFGLDGLLILNIKNMKLLTIGRIKRGVKLQKHF